MLRAACAPKWSHATSSYRASLLQIAATFASECAPATLAPAQRGPMRKHTQRRQLDLIPAPSHPRGRGRRGAPRNAAWRRPPLVGLAQDPLHEVLAADTAVYGMHVPHLQEGGLCAPPPQLHRDGRELARYHAIPSIRSAARCLQRGVRHQFRRRRSAIDSVDQGRE
jgi:hypothetical protein